MTRRSIRNEQFRTWLAKGREGPVHRGVDGKFRFRVDGITYVLNGDLTPEEIVSVMVSGTEDAKARCRAIAHARDVAQRNDAIAARGYEHSYSPSLLTERRGADRVGAWVFTDTVPVNPPARTWWQRFWGGT